MVDDNENKPRPPIAPAMKPSMRVAPRPGMTVTPSVPEGAPVDSSAPRPRPEPSTSGPRPRAAMSVTPSIPSGAPVESSAPRPRASASRPEGAPVESSAPRARGAPVNLTPDTPMSDGPTSGGPMPGADGPVETSGARPRAPGETSGARARPDGIVGATPKLAPARALQSEDPIADALCDEYMEDQELWAFGELKDMRALAPRALTRDRRGAQACDVGAIYTILLSRNVSELAAQAFALRVEARLARVGIATVLPVPLLRLTAEQREAILKPPPPPEPAQPKPPPPAAKVEVEREAPVPARTPAEIARDEQRLRRAWKVGGAVAAAAAIAGIVLVTRANAAVEVAVTALVHAPAKEVWDVASELERQARFAPWFEGASKGAIEGDVLRTTVGDEDLTVRQWNLALGQHVEMRATGARTVASAMDLVEEPEGTRITWTVTSPRGAANAFRDVTRERTAALQQGLVHLEAAAKALAAERAAAAAAEEAAQQALFAHEKKGLEDVGPQEGLDPEELQETLAQEAAKAARGLTVQEALAAARARKVVTAPALGTAPPVDGKELEEPPGAPVAQEPHNTAPAKKVGKKPPKKRR